MTAEAVAEQRTAGADAGAAGATQQTGQATGAAGGHTYETREIGQDVNDIEVLRATAARTFDTNSKYLNEQNSNAISDARRADTFAARVAEELFDRRMRLIDKLDNTYAIGYQNLVDEQKRNMAQETRHVDLAVDRQWNIDEQVFGVTAAIKALLAAGVVETSILASLAKTAENLSARKAA